MQLDVEPVDYEAIDAVVFDIGGVFVVRHPEPVRTGMARGGFDLPDDDGRLYHDAHYRAVRALTDRLDGGPVDEYARDFWIHYELAYLGHLGVEEHRREQGAAVMAAEVFVKEPKPVWRLLLERNIEAFRALAASGMPVAVVTNNDGTAAWQLEHFGIAQVGPGPLTEVAAIADSGVLGVAKPSPGIFQPALDALGTDPARTLYVGDTVHADVYGATAAGMPVVQLDPLDLHAHLTHERAADVATVAGRLGVRG
jgi:FMN phosphatase YigB (HAD superfamily)